LPSARLCAYTFDDFNHSHLREQAICLILQTMAEVVVLVVGVVSLGVQLAESTQKVKRFTAP
jgi:hypothetical protein